MPDNAELLAVQRAEREAHYDTAIAEWHRDHDHDNPAHLTAAAIAACTICDEDGYRPTRVVCDHIDHAPAARAGMAAVRAALAKDARS